MGEPHQFLDRLERVRPTSNGGWRARCPGHDDDTPSLSIDVGEDGRLLLRCHAGCTTEAICAAAGTPTSALFPPRTSPDVRHPRPRSPQAASFVARDAARVWRLARARAREDATHADDLAVYEYLGARGLAEVWETPGFGILASGMSLPQPVRLWPSTGHRIVVPLRDGTGQVASLQARSIHPDAERKVLFPAGSAVKGCVFANGPGVALLCGRLRPPCTVLLGEGLTDYLAIACAAGGYPVLSAPGTGFAEGVVGGWAKGTRVVVAMDNDEAGRRCMDGVVHQLYRAGARDVFRVVWPEGCKDACEVVDRVGLAGLEDFVAEQMAKVRAR